MQYQNDIHYWLAIPYLSGIGLQNLLRGLQAFGDLKNFFHATPADLKSLEFTTKQITILKNLNWDAVEKDLEWCQQNQCHVIAYTDVEYSNLLREISSPPLMLYAQGDAALLNT